MSAGKVDVLAVMDYREARDAVSRYASANLTAWLIEAAKVFDAKYAAGDGDLGVGLTNGDFFRLRAALVRVQP